MSKVLLICYYFPPLGGAGISRPLALFKHLPSNGIECDVLTVKPVLYRVYEQELYDGLELSKIYRSGSYDPQRLMYLMGMRKIKDEIADESHKFSKRFFPDSKVRWVSKAVRLGRTLIENKKYDALISTSPPISSHLIAKKISNEFKIPWIADFRDIWTSYKPEHWYNSKKMINKAKSLLDEITESATTTVSANKSIDNYLGTDNFIYNSYDSELSNLWTKPSNSNLFTIGILGTIDKLTPIEPLLKLIYEYRKKYPENYEKIRICQVGRINLIDFDVLLEKYKLKDMITIHRFKDRSTTIKLLNESALLYLGVDHQFGSHLTPGRIFNMLASGRTILLSAPDESEIAELISNKNGGYIFNENNLLPAIEYFNQMIQNYNPKNISPLPDYALEHSSENMVKKYVQVIKNLID